MNLSNLSNRIQYQLNHHKNETIHVLETTTEKIQHGIDQQTAHKQSGTSRVAKKKEDVLYAQSLELD